MNITRIATSLFLLFVVTISAPASPVVAGQESPDQTATSINLPGPAGSASFGASVTTLPNGNIVVLDPGYATNTGRISLVDGKTLTILNTMQGSHANDNVGSGGVVILPNGDYLVVSPNWSSANVGGAAGGGAVTYCSASTGCPDGVVTTTNSLIGIHANDHVGLGGVVMLTNGGYAVDSYHWNYNSTAGVGAVTACPAVGCKNMVVGLANSLIGSTAGDDIGIGGIIPILGGAFVVLSPIWFNSSNSSTGAATYCPAAGCHAVVSGNTVTGNSVTGQKANDMVGIGGIALAGGGYVIISPMWTNNTGYDVGAVTACPPAGCAPGLISTGNSLVGSQEGDSVGQGKVVALPSGNYVVDSPQWSSQSSAHVGAVTYCAITNQTPFGCASQSISATNSLIGNIADDNVGFGGVTVLAGGGYVVSSNMWNLNNTTSKYVGAVTACPPDGCRGYVIPANSLIGDQMGDMVGDLGGTRALPGGGFVVKSTGWHTNTGAVTTCPAAGCPGTIVSTANSLVGALPGDHVGLFPSILLTSGNFVVPSPWVTLGGKSRAGAATFCPQAGCLPAIVSAANSLVGSSVNDQVGGQVGDMIYPLATGGYVVASNTWNKGAIASVGAVTPCPAAGCPPGPVSAANSLLGGKANDNVGANGVWPLTWGGYITRSNGWDSSTIADAGAYTLCRPAGCIGAISASNSVMGGIANQGGSLSGTYDTVGGRMVVGRPAENLVTFFSLAAAPTSTQITTDLSSSTAKGAGYSVSVSVSSAGGIPTGVVIITDAAGGACNLTLSNATGTCSLVSIKSGTLQISATYQGDPLFSTSQATASHTVRPGEVYLPSIMK